MMDSLFPCKHTKVLRCSNWIRNATSHCVTAAGGKEIKSRIKGITEKYI